MKKLLLSVGIIGLIMGCKNNDPVAPSEDVDALYEAFHGKYRIVSAETSEAVDVNMDGIGSTDLLSEIPLLEKESMAAYYAEIRIYSPFRGDRSNFIFTQNWPEQDVRLGRSGYWNGTDIVPFDAANSVGYSMKVLIRQMAFTENMKQILVTPDPAEAPVFKQSAPKLVTIERDGSITVTADRKFYTREGVKQVEVVIKYERFTMST